MSFLKSLFGGKGKKPVPDTDPMPTRELRLSFAPSPENGILFAQQFVGAVKQNEGIELDYSVDTIDFVDKFLQRFSDEGLSVNDFAETIFIAGSYVGQVMVNNNEGLWVAQAEAGLPEGVTMMPLVIKLPNGTITDPIAKAFKRFHFGESDDLKYYYHVFTSPRP
ncbi:hypothetical protein Q4E93_19040 [Flavitalea sp. BT771]|uniref:hypothetical protein n=1 Tax=Flavitalea sp. BT771 TaxID=3063329 RepID=UPI0026E282E6|nr:hypothetical protein [Flavitalea sp. BT771]MDO6432710.1 hypothetical protein [Flavitalea sp. BT771]MDV6222014.1 hypothetical protein [Flavitalea sp. BT771]